VTFGVPRALLLLLLLRGKGWLRRSFSTASPQRLIMSIIGLGMFLLWAASFILPSLLTSGRSGRPRPSPDSIVLFGGILAFCFTAIPMAAGGATKWLTFSPAELDQVVPGPFSRRHLLTYKLFAIAAGSMISALIFSFVARPQDAFWPLQFLGALLLMLFTGMLTVCFALVSEVAWRKRIPLRLGLGVVLIALAARSVSIAVAAVTLDTSRGPDQVIEKVTQDPVLIAVGVPFRPFLNVFTAGGWSLDVAAWLTVCVGLLVVVYLLLMNLDAVAIDRSVRSAYDAAIKAETKPRAGGPARVWRGSSAFVPALEFLGPSRAIVRKQFQTSLTTFVGLPLLLIALGGLGAWLSSFNREIATLAPIVLTGIALWSCAFGRVDFRADLDHLSTLKALPLFPRAITLAQIAPTWLAVSLGHFAGASILLAASMTLDVPTLSLQIALLLLTAPAAALVIVFENLFFLHFPSRPVSKGAFNFGLTGRAIVVTLARAAALLVVASVCAPLTIATYYALGLWPAAGVLAMQVAVVVMGLILLTSRAFAKFDIAVDMPDDPR
jgi:hypothetical protein